MTAGNSHIVIIGGSYSGLTTAQKVFALLPNVKITLISTSENYYFNLAAPRLLARPKEVKTEQVVFSIPEVFKKHPSTRFEFVHGSATSLDTTKKTVTTDNSSFQAIQYDYLVIASGSHTLSTISKQVIPMKQTVTDDLKQSIEEAQKYIGNAKTIVIGGGGPVAVELSSEIAEAYPDKKITLVTGGERLLPTIKPSAGASAASQLQKLKIELVFKHKVEDAKFDEATSIWTVKLSDGTSLQADLYIAAVGLFPNNKFIPKSLQDKDGWVNVENTLRVQGVSSVYALGDITSLPGRMAINAKAQSTIVSVNLAVDINGTGTLKSYGGGKNGMFVPIGKSGGTGQIGPVVPWSWIVSKVKGQSYFIPSALAFVS